MEFLTLDYWFHVRPSVMPLKLAAVLAAALFLLVVAGIYFFAKSSQEDNRRRGRLWSRLGSWCITWAVIGFVWIFLAYERINFFGARFWVLIGLVLAIIWLIPIVRYATRTLPALDTAARERAEFEKYLPKKKR